MTASEGTAQSPADFTGGTQTVTLPDPTEPQPAFIPIHEDSTVESLETVELSLHNPTRGTVVAYPDDAVLTIADDDGAARASFQFASYSQFESVSALKIWVVRSGDASQGASVNYATSDGSATEGNDYERAAGTLNFGENSRFKSFYVYLKNNSTPENTETFSVNLNGASGMTLMNPSSTTITIQDDDTSSTTDETPPYTAFHQPLHRHTYTPKEAKEYMVFMQDNDGGSGMKKVQLGIRKNLSGGRCAWWNGSRFKRSACNVKVWAKTRSWSETKVEYYSEMALFTLSTKLKKSIRGSGIKNYTAFSRGIDNVGNKQDTFQKAQNKNNFEVK
jgi:hypothetical protein